MKRIMVVAFARCGVLSNRHGVSFPRAVSGATPDARTAFVTVRGRRPVSMASTCVPPRDHAKWPGAEPPVNHDTAADPYPYENRADHGVRMGIDAEPHERDPLCPWSLPENDPR